METSITIKDIPSKFSKLPSAAFFQVLDDVVAVRQKGINFNMNYWMQTKGYKDAVPDVCSVCLAGASMVHRFNISDDDAVPMELMIREVISIHDKNVMQLMDITRANANGQQPVLASNSLSAAFRNAFKCAIPVEVEYQIRSGLLQVTFEHNSPEADRLEKFLGMVGHLLVKHGM